MCGGIVAIRKFTKKISPGGRNARARCATAVAGRNHSAPHNAPHRDGAGVPISSTLSTTAESLNPVLGTLLSAFPTAASARCAKFRNSALEPREKRRDKKGFGKAGLVTRNRPG